MRIGENQVVDFALYTGKELSEEEAEALQGSAQRQQRKEKALELLARKPQSRRELEKKLTQWGAEEDEVQTVCDRMEQLGIYEVAPEDFAAAEYVDTSKLELQKTVREGLDYLRKELS